MRVAALRARGPAVRCPRAQPAPGTGVQVRSHLLRTHGRSEVRGRQRYEEQTRASRPALQRPHLGALHQPGGATVGHRQAERQRRDLDVPGPLLPWGPLPLSPCSTLRVPSEGRIGHSPAMTGASVKRSEPVPSPTRLLPEAPLLPPGPGWGLRGVACEVHLPLSVPVRLSCGRAHPAVATVPAGPRKTVPQGSGVDMAGAEPAGSHSEGLCLRVERWWVSPNMRLNLDPTGETEAGIVGKQ